MLAIIFHDFIQQQDQMTLDGRSYNKNGNIMLKGIMAARVIVLNWNRELLQSVSSCEIISHAKLNWGMLKRMNLAFLSLEFQLPC